MIDRAPPAYEQVADSIRAAIQAGTYPPGSELPSEADLAREYRVSGTTIKSAMAYLRAEGRIESRQGQRAIVAREVKLTRTSDLVAWQDGFYTMLERAGLEPNTVTTVDPDGTAPEDAADMLGIRTGQPVVIRHRLMRAVGLPPLMLATSYFPTWVVAEAPNLANPNVHHMPRWLREAFGLTYSEDWIDARNATDAEATQLEIEPGSPVVYLTGVTRDQRERTLHFIRVIKPGGQMPFNYRYGYLPTGEA